MKLDAQKNWTAYLVSPGREAELRHELQDAKAQSLGPWIISQKDVDVSWAQDTWRNVRSVDAPSITKAAAALKEIGKPWYLFPTAHHRRASLIEEQLPRLRAQKISFPSALTTKFLGWTLVEQDTLWISDQTEKPYAGGVPEFADAAGNPPSQAYLKLWEGLTLKGSWPGPQDLCLDLGSSPGGWTWALLKLGAKVTSVDKADLDPSLKDSRLTYIRKDAFRLKPEDLSQQPTWVFSDVICYPERLFEFLETWGSIKPRPHFFFTLKFQGPTDFAVMEKFKALPGSKLKHLYFNKHELTWISS